MKYKMKKIMPKVEDEESLEKEFKWAVEGLLLPLVCLVGVLGNINISLWIKRKRKWKIKTFLSTFYFGQ